MTHEAHKCMWCGLIHSGQRCPLVKAIDYYENGNIKRVEFVTPGDHLAPTQYLNPKPPLPWQKGIYD